MIVEIKQYYSLYCREVVLFCIFKNIFLYGDTFESDLKGKDNRGVLKTTKGSKIRCYRPFFSRLIAQMQTKSVNLVHIRVIPFAGVSKENCNFEKCVQIGKKLKQYLINSLEISIRWSWSIRRMMCLFLFAVYSQIPIECKCRNKNILVESIICASSSGSLFPSHNFHSLYEIFPLSLLHCDSFQRKGSKFHI